MELLATGGRWTEGSVWFGDGRYLLWSDIPNDRILRWDETTGGVSVFRSPSNNANGNTRDRQGPPHHLASTGRRATRTEHDGRITVLMDSFEGKRLNSPNDVVVKSDGTIWFTDPGYGLLKNPMRVRWRPRTAATFTVSTRRAGRLPSSPATSTGPTASASRPTSRCYIVLPPVSQRPMARFIRVFGVVNGGARLANGRLFVDMAPGVADGIRTDLDGNVWRRRAGAARATDGAHRYAARRHAHRPHPPARTVLQPLWRHQESPFMTAGQSLYSIFVETTGQRP